MAPNAAVHDLVTYLRALHPEVIPIACHADDKHPRYEYRDGKWTWAKWDASELDGFAADEPPTDVLGVLIPRDSIVVVDFDTPEAMVKFEGLFADVSSHTAIETTRRGYHVWFAPSEHSRGLTTTCNSALKIDVKAGSATTDTPAVCVVAPSPNKEWLYGQEPWTIGLLPMPEEVATWLREHVYPQRSYEHRSAVPDDAPAHALEDVDFAQVERVVMALGEDTYGGGSYEAWLSVVHAVTNLGARAGREDDARSLLHRFSEQGGVAYDARALNAKIRDTRHGPGFGFAQLKRLLERSNPAVYSEMYGCAAGDPGLVDKMREWARTIGGEPRDQVAIADMVLEIIGKDHIVSVGADSRNQFYVWNGNRWKLDPSSTWLCDKMHRVVAQRVEDVLRATQAELDTEVLPEVRRLASAQGIHDIKSRSAMVQVAMNNLRESHEALFKRKADLELQVEGFKKARESLVNDTKAQGVVHIINTTTHQRRPRFVQELDANEEALGFDNGILFSDGTFRAGRPEDMVSRTVGYDWNQEDDIEIQADLERTIGDMVPDPEVRECLLALAAYTMFGSKKSEVVAMFTGKGRNGKTKFAGLLEGALGTVLDEGTPGYSYPAPATFFVGSESSASSGPSPDIASFKGARCVVFSEPRGALNIPRIKAVSGKDPMTGRQLHRPLITFRPVCQLFFLFNVVPPMPGADEAFLKRLVVIEFPISFLDEPRFSNERKVDLGLEERFKRVAYKQQFVRWMVRKYIQHDIRNKGLPPLPEAVKAERVRLMEHADPMRAFINLAERENWIERCEPGDGEMDVADFRAAFHTYMLYNDRDYTQWKAKTVGDAVARNGIKYRKSHGRTFYQGIRCVGSLEVKLCEYAAAG